MSGLHGKDDKHSGARDLRSGAYDKGAKREDLSRGVVPGDDMPEGLQRKPAGAPNKGFRRGGPVKHVP
jgi:hypothetical protein